jgi:hypothetical protein
MNLPVAAIFIVRSLAAGKTVAMVDSSLRSCNHTPPDEIAEDHCDAASMAACG